MKIAVIGSGGVGGYIGACLGKFSSDDVTLVARGEHAEVMAQKGLGIIEDNETWYSTNFKVVTLETLDQIYDLILVCVKSYDLDTAIEAITRHSDHNSIVVPFGNGIAPYERLKAGCDARVLRGAIYILSHLEGAGYIRKKGKVFAAVIGSQEDSAAVEKVKELFDTCHLRIKTPENIEEAIWKKYIFIGAFATLTSFFNKNMRAVAQEHKEETLGLLSEIAEVAMSQGVAINEEIEKSYQTALSLPESATSSMHLDFQKAKRTELETLSGYIVKRAKDKGVAVPIMEKMYRALKSELYQN